MWLLNCCFFLIGCEFKAGDRCCEDAPLHGDEESEPLMVCFAPLIRFIRRSSSFSFSYSLSLSLSLSCLTPVSSILQGHDGKGANGGQHEQHALVTQQPKASPPGAAAAEHPPPKMPHGQLGVFMLMVEFLDAIPEAAVIAIRYSEGEDDEETRMNE